MIVVTRVDGKHTNEIVLVREDGQLRWDLDATDERDEKKARGSRGRSTTPRRDRRSGGSDGKGGPRRRGPLHLAANPSFLAQMWPGYRFTTSRHFSWIGSIDFVSLNPQTPVQ